MKTILSLLIISLFFCSCEKTRIAGVPDCIQDKIDVFKMLPKGNPPRSIVEYTYNNKRVFYVPPQCCDQYSDLFDENCNLLGHPDGGFSGRGDGKFPNFFNDAKDPKLIWKDDR
jgi:hypothetical protein